MKLKTYPIPFFLFAFAVLTSCKKTSAPDPTAGTITVSKLNGYVQKGPFILGSSITLFELDNSLNPTGKSFNTQTTDNKGSFNFNNITLSSSYVSIKADGYYFNEAQLVNSNSPITLYALCQVSDSANINVNLLTTLEKNRVEHLLGQGTSFEAAKRQAQREILSIFKMNENGVPNSENLSMAASGQENAILLAISTIFQGGLGYDGLESRVSELLASFSNDIKNDGILNDNSLAQKLLDNVITLDTTAIRNGIIAKYGQLGTPTTISDFGKYVDSFISITSSEIYASAIYYPYHAYYPLSSGPSNNLLNLSDTIYRRDLFELSAYLGRNSSITVKIKELETNPNTSPHHSYFILNGNTISPEIADGKYTYTISLPINFYHIELQAGYRYLIEYYENGSTSLTRQKEIKIIN